MSKPSAGEGFPGRIGFGLLFGLLVVGLLPYFLSFFVLWLVYAAIVLPLCFVFLGLGWLAGWRPTGHKWKKSKEQAEAEALIAELDEAERRQRIKDEEADWAKRQAALEDAERRQRTAEVLAEARDNLTFTTPDEARGDAVDRLRQTFPGANLVEEDDHQEDDNLPVTEPDTEDKDGLIPF